MTPAPIGQGSAASPSPPQQQRKSPTASPGAKAFDDSFHSKFMHIIQEWKDDPQRGQLTQKDRKAFIETAYVETDHLYFGMRPLSDHDVKLRALTKVFYKVLAEEPWSEDWIRAPHVERKLSRFEMHKGSLVLAAEHGIFTPRNAVKAAREAALKQQETARKTGKEAEKADQEPQVPRGPYDDIEIIYIAGTVSSTATNRIDREAIYPVSVSSVANVLQNHICRDMVRPFSMAERFLNCTDTQELEKLRKFACDVCDFAPHLLDNDNVSLLVVLLILPRSDCCRRFENNGIRIEGSTISHRKAECMKNKMGWKTAEQKKPYDSFATEFQARVKNACFPPAPARTHNHRGAGAKGKSRKSSTPATPLGPLPPPPPSLSSSSSSAPAAVYSSPHMGYYMHAYGVGPPTSPHAVNSAINIPHPPIMHAMLPPGPLPPPPPPPHHHLSRTAPPLLPHSLPSPDGQVSEPRDRTHGPRVVARSLPRALTSADGHALEPMDLS